MPKCPFSAHTGVVCSRISNRIPQAAWVISRVPRDSSTSQPNISTKFKVGSALDLPPPLPHILPGCFSSLMVWNPWGSPAHGNQILSNPTWTLQAWRGLSPQPALDPASPWLLPFQGLPDHPQGMGPSSTPGEGPRGRRLEAGDGGGGLQGAAGSGEAGRFPRVGRL